MNFEDKPLFPDSGESWACARFLIDYLAAWFSKWKSRANCLVQDSGLPWSAGKTQMVLPFSRFRSWLSAGKARVTASRLRVEQVKPATPQVRWGGSKNHHRPYAVGYHAPEKIKANQNTHSSPLSAGEFSRPPLSPNLARLCELETRPNLEARNGRTQDNYTIPPSRVISRGTGGI